MNTIRSEAIVLRTYKLAEADLICVLLTRDHGKVRAVAHGVRRTSCWGPGAASASARSGLPAGQALRTFLL